MIEKILELLKENMIPEAKISEDGKRYVAIYQKLYTCSIIAGTSEYSHDEFWCFQNYREAKTAMDKWSGNKGTEPEGWHRHVPSHRRRPDGDKTKEYINP